MSQEKGKGPARDGGTTDNTGSDRDKSLLSRIAASATGLTQSVLAPPSRNEVNESTAAALSSSDKRQHSSISNSSYHAESSTASQLYDSKLSDPKGLRSSHQDQHVTQTETEFSSFLDGIPSFTNSDNNTLTYQTSEQIEQLPTTWGDAWALSQYYNHAPNEKPDHTFITLEEQEALDGSEVLNLLSSPTLTIQTHKIPSMEQGDETYDWGLSSDQLAAIRSITRELFPSPSVPHSPMPSNHLLNLMPHGENTDTSMSSPAKEASVDELYVRYEVDGVPVSGVQVWREQWEGVLGRYTDEVWGDLTPLVIEAKREIEEAVEGTTTEEPVAVRRLRGILGHLRKT